MQIDSVDPDRLRPYPNNARTHSRKQIGQIAKSIQRFGFCNPVLIDDNNQIVAGHGRVAAAKLLRLTTVPVVRLSHLSEAEKRAYILADNRLAERAGWDRELLAIELQGLTDLNFEVDLTGFESAEVDFILDDTRATKTGAEDDTPAYADGVPVTREHDLWALGTHRLLCADAREQASFDVLLGGQKAQFVFTDPLYNDGNGLGSIPHREFAKAGGKMSEADLVGFLTTTFERLAANTIDGSIHMVCMDWRHLGEMAAAGREVYSELKNLCIWNKTNAEVGSFYRSKHELISVWKNGTAALINSLEGKHGRHRSNVWDYSGIPSTRTKPLKELARQPTIKPVELVADAIKDISGLGDLVLDPFAGSGTVLIAAECTGRNACALEIDPLYVDVAVRRWQTYTGKSAVLVATGETFEQREKQCTNETTPV
jgi:hypothetical protein